MTDDTRPCPICQGTMEFRLNEFVCTGCTYRAPRELPKAKVSFKRQEVAPKHTGLPKYIPPVPGTDPASSRTVFSPQDYDSTARVRIHGSQELPPIFRIQKVILISLLTLMAVINVLMMAPQFEYWTFEYGSSFVGGLLFGQALSLLVWGWALFSTNLIVKYIFAVLSGLNTLSMLVLLIFLIWATNTNGFGPPELLVPFVGAILYIIVLGALWLQAWMFYLIYTDITVLSN